MTDPKAKSEIKTLILVILSGLVGAVFLSLSLLYLYGPTGQYSIKHALISPELVTTFNYNGLNHKTGGMTRFVFDNMTFKYFDVSTKQHKEIFVPTETYKKIYALISKDKSILNPSPDLATLFKQELGQLTINVRTESHAAWVDETKVFQSIHFSSTGNDYRVQLHEEKNPAGEWVYFHHPSIYKQVFEMIIPPL